MQSIEKKNEGWIVLKKFFKKIKQSFITEMVKINCLWKVFEFFK
jgi:hypothetical protein